MQTFSQQDMFIALLLAFTGFREDEDAGTSGASEERPQPHVRALGKRPAGKWSKLGSDADSPPGKRVKTQVPGVKAANGQSSCLRKCVASVVAPGCICSQPCAVLSLHQIVLAIGASWDRC